MSSRDYVQRLSYGVLFCCVAPALLATWAAAAEKWVALPVYGTRELGVAILIAGAAMVISGMALLLFRGRGLPMNAFPPTRYVATGLYQFIPHPIYAGFTLMCLGMSMVARSGSGLWLVTPAVAFGCAGIVLGYEAEDLRRRFGDARTCTWLPGDTDAEATALDRLRFVALTIVPWLALYAIVAALGVAPDAVDIRLPFEHRLPVIAWTESVYASTYLLVPLACVIVRSRRTLRSLMIRAWLAMAIAFPLYLALPVAAPRPAFTPVTALGRLLEFERGSYPAAVAFPSFHVVWAILVAEVFVDRGRLALWMARVWASAVAVSCVTTGMHSVADVLAGAVLGWICIDSARVWQWLRQSTERIANSWKEWRIGSVRIISHGLYGGVAGGAAVLIVEFLIGPGHTISIVATAASAIIGAAVWAQWVEGSPRLLRPFGFYGGMFGVTIAAWAGRLAGWDAWLLIAAYCTASPVMQSIGRLRCLVQGCCHGRPAPDGIGIRYTRVESRVVRIAQLGGVPVHPTPLYSILWNGFVFLAMARLWIAGAPLHIIAGIFAILTGLGRFVEEGYRGEPQTPVFANLRLYQWIAVGTVVLGAAITAVATSGRAPLPVASFESVWLAAIFGLISMCAMGVDFPESTRRLARLT